MQLLEHNGAYCLLIIVSDESFFFRHVKKYPETESNICRSHIQDGKFLLLEVWKKQVCNNLTYTLLEYIFQYGEVHS